MTGWCADCRASREWTPDARARWVCGGCGRRRYDPPDDGPPRLDGVQVLEQAVGVLARVAGLRTTGWCRTCEDVRGMRQDGAGRWRCGACRVLQPSPPEPVADVGNLRFAREPSLITPADPPNRPPPPKPVPRVVVDETPRRKVRVRPGLRNPA